MRQKHGGVDHAIPVQVGLVQEMFIVYDWSLVEVCRLVEEAILVKECIAVKSSCLCSRPDS